jgi:hypothetical protein
MRQTGEIHKHRVRASFGFYFTKSCAATLAEQVTARRPSVKVLFMTGYSRNTIVHHGRLDPGVQMIRSRSPRRRWSEKSRISCTARRSTRLVSHRTVAVSL